MSGTRDERTPLAAGTSGWSYAPWRGVFYPDDLPSREWLRFYAERLPTVEVNNTFYRMPRASVLEAWAAQVPETFRFSVKASRRITHIKRLKDVAEETDYLLRTLAVLGPRLGVVYVQLPPNLRADLPRLGAFLDLLPESTPAAFEFRHPSWQEEGAPALLRERGRALVQVDAEESPLRALADPGRLLYLRLRRAEYGPDALGDWAARIASSGAERALVYFKHEDAATGPRLATELLALVQSRGAAPARVRLRKTPRRETA